MTYTSIKKHMILKSKKQGMRLSKKCTGLLLITVKIPNRPSEAEKEQFKSR